jgi:hypothetical protein
VFVCLPCKVDAKRNVVKLLLFVICCLLNGTICLREINFLLGSNSVLIRTLNHMDSVLLIAFSRTFEEKEKIGLKQITTILDQAHFFCELFYVTH